MLRPSPRGAAQGLAVTAVPFGALRQSDIAAWRRLQRLHPHTDSPFLSPGFTQAVSEVREDVHVAVLHQDGDTVGFLPFHRGRSGYGRAIGMRIADLQGAVIAPHVDWSGEQLLRGAGLTTLRFFNLLESTEPLRRYHWGSSACPVIDLQDGFQAYRAGRRLAGSRLVEQALRKARKLEREVGPLRFELSSSSPAALSDLLAWKAQQRRRTRTFNVLEVDWVARLLTHMCARSYGEVRAVLSTLHVGDRLAAVHLGLRNDRTLHFWFPSFDFSLRRYSPGLVLTAKLLQACPDVGVDRIVLGPGTEPFKLSLATSSVAVATAHLTNRDAVWAAGRAWYRSRQRLRTSPLRPVMHRPQQLIRGLEHRHGMR